MLCAVMFPPPLVLDGLIVVEALPRLLIFDLFLEVLFLTIVFAVGRLVVAPNLAVEPLTTFVVEVVVEGNVDVDVDVDVSVTTDVVLAAVVVAAATAVAVAVGTVTLAVVVVIFSNGVKTSRVDVVVLLVATEPELVLKIRAFGGSRSVFEGRKGLRNLLVAS